MPKTEDGRMGFVAVDDNLELRFEEAVNWGNEDVEGEDNEIIFLGPPLKVVLQANLNRSRVGEGSRNYWLVVHNVKELGGGKSFVLKGPQLSIRPPVLVPRHYLQKSGRVGGKGASSKFRGDY